MVNPPDDTRRTGSDAMMGKTGAGSIVTAGWAEGERNLPYTKR
jgi:hypothetical protein